MPPARGEVPNSSSTRSGGSCAPAALVRPAPHLEGADEGHARGHGAALRPLLVGHGQVDDHPANQACRERGGLGGGRWVGHISRICSASSEKAPPSVLASWQPHPPGYSSQNSLRSKLPMRGFSSRPMKKSSAHVCWRSGQAGGHQCNQRVQQLTSPPSHLAAARSSMFPQLQHSHRR